MHTPNSRFWNKIEILGKETIKSPERPQPSWAQGTKQPHTIYSSHTYHQILELWNIVEILDEREDGEEGEVEVGGLRIRLHSCTKNLRFLESGSKDRTRPLHAYIQRDIYAY